MANIREKYKVQLDNKKEKDKKKTEKANYDIASYPFGAEEMLLNLEIKQHLKDDDFTK